MVSSMCGPGTFQKMRDHLGKRDAYGKIRRSKEKQRGLYRLEKSQQVGPKNVNKREGLGLTSSNIQGGGNRNVPGVKKAGGKP